MSISIVVFSMIGVAVYGTAEASAVIIGQTVGSGDYDRVKQYAKKLQISAASCGEFNPQRLKVLKR